MAYGDGRGTNRWTRQVSTWIQKLRTSHSTASPDRKPSALNYDFEVGSKTLQRLFDSNVAQGELLSSIKNDIFLLVLYQRKAFLLPKFHPRSLHFIEASTLGSTISPAPRRNSEPNLFGLDFSLASDYKRQSLPNLADSFSVDKLTSSQKVDQEDSFKGVKQKIRERFSWLLNSPISNIIGQRFSQEVDENTRLFPKLPRRPSEEPTQSISHSYLLSEPLNLDGGPRPIEGTTTGSLGTRSYPSRETECAQLKLDVPTDEGGGLAYRLPTTLQREVRAFEENAIFERSSYERFREDQDLVQSGDGREALQLPYEKGKAEIFPPSAHQDTRGQFTDVAVEMDDKNIVVTTLKSIQDNVTNLTCKLRNRYSKERSLSASIESDETLLLKKVEIESGTPILLARKAPLQNLPPCEEYSNLRDCAEAEYQTTNNRAVLERTPSHSSESATSSPKIRKMLRQRSNEEFSEEPLPKHLRSASLDEARLQMPSEVPVRPQRKRYLMKHCLDSESGDDDSKGSSLDDLEYQSRKGIQHSRKQFLEKMVSFSSEEEFAMFQPRYKSSHYIQRKVIVRDVPRLISQNNSIPSDNKDELDKANDDLIFESESLSGEKSLQMIEKCEKQNDVKESLVGDEVVPYFVTRLELESSMCQEKERSKYINEAKCDKLPTTTECFQEALLETSSYNFNAISTHTEGNVLTNDSLSCVEEHETKIPLEISSVTEVERCSDYSSGNDEVPNDDCAKETNGSHSHVHCRRSRSDSQPHIFVTPAEASEEEISGRGKPKPAFSFVKVIGPQHHTESDWSYPAIPVSIPFGNGSSIGSQPESLTTFFSELEDLHPPIGERFNVSPNLSPSPRATSPVLGASDRYTTSSKSPINVQEWIDSLPINISGHGDDDADFEHGWAEEAKMETREHSDSTVEETADRAIKNEDSQHLVDEALGVPSEASTSHSNDELRSFSESSANYVRASPRILQDIQQTMNEDESESPVLAKEETPCKRSLFAETREKQTSFQSETSILSETSQKTVSSLESLLESRQLDPFEILLNLCFGSAEEEEGVSRIPPRFLKPSKVPGNDINEFLKEEGNFSELVDSSEWVVPNIPSQVLRRMSVKTVSPLVVNLMETVRENQLQRRQKVSTKSDSSVCSEGTKSSLSRFANVAKNIGTKALFARRLRTKIDQEQENNHFSGNERPLPFRNSVLMPENRRYLDLQGQRCLEAPKRRLIIGGNSFNLGNNGEILDSHDEEKEEESHQIAEGEEERKDEEVKPNIIVDPIRHHRNSVSSVVSSIPSIDSKEEAYLEELRQLTLSVKESISFTDQSNSAYENRKKNLMKRLTMTSSSSKRKMLVSQSSSCSDHWDVKTQITEEKSSVSSSPSPPPKMAVSANEPISFDKTPTKSSSTKGKKSLVRQDSLDQGTDHKFSPLHNFQDKWTLESDPSMETLKRYPLNRSCAIVSSVAEGMSGSPGVAQEVESMSGGRGRGNHFGVRRPRKLRRAASLPDVLAGKGGEEQRDLNTGAMQMSLNTAMIALLHACKAQVLVQNHLMADSAARRSMSNISFHSDAKDVECERHSDVFSVPTTPHRFSHSFDDPQQPFSNVTDPAACMRRSFSVASHMRGAMTSVISHLEDYLKETSSSIIPTSPDVTNIVSQMLLLSQHQSQLCSDLELLSSSGTISPTQSTLSSIYPSRMWGLPRQTLYRSMPEQLDSRFPSASAGAMSASPSVYSAPYYPLASPPPFSPPFYASPSLKAGAINSANAPLIQRGGGKTQTTFSHSSFDEGTMDYRASDAAGSQAETSEWNDGKTSEVSSPAFSWNRSIRSPDSAISDYLAEKISQEIEENFGSKVNELSHKLEKNSADVSSIKDKLTAILQCLQPDTRG